ncbi:MAG: hypothetical protein HQ498_09125 [Pseudohongiella sp.]|nr:hypothetical protein [Pseudohongiella sp.]
MIELSMGRLRSNAQVLAIWNNPIVWKNFKSRMRMQALFYCLLVLIISAFMTLTIFSGIDRIQEDSVQAARAGIIPLGIVQWVILMLSATGRISSGIIHERVTGTIDYTRLTPMSPMTKVLGYLFGLPVREYIAFAITLPFMVFLLIVGEIPLSVILPVYLVFFSSALLYHLIGTVFGLVMKEWRMSVVFTVGIVVLINLVLPLFSYLGFPFLQYLTIRPVVVEKIFPYLAENSSWRSTLPDGLISTQVDFFNWKVSTTFFSLLLQSSLIFTLGLMVYRKWESFDSHSLSKIYALFFFIGIQVFCIGTLWPNLVFNENSIFSLALAGDESSIEEFAVVIPLVYCFFTLLCVFWLLYVITPTHDEYRSGLLRAKKLQQMKASKLPVFADFAGSLFSAIALAACTFAFLLFVQATMINSGPLADIPITSINYFKMPLAAVLIIFYYYVSLEYLELNKFAILFLCVWVVPILLAIFLGVAFEFEDLTIYIASVSPISLTILSVQGMAGDSLRSADYQLASNAYWIGAGVILMLTAFLGYQLKMLKAKTKIKIAQPK